MDLELIGRRIKTARMERGITQEALAEMLEITPRSIQNIEAGSSATRFDIFIELCHHLGVMPNDICYGSQNESSTKILEEANSILIHAQNILNLEINKINH